MPTPDMQARPTTSVLIRFGLDFLPGLCSTIYQRHVDSVHMSEVEI
jgi:hypothetical protein